MASASVQVSGQGAEQLARELQAVLRSNAASADSVSPVEVDRSAELVIAVIGLVFAGVDAAKTIWDWWQSRRSTGVTVKILLDDGAQVDLSGVDREQLQLEFGRRAKRER